LAQAPRAESLNLWLPLILPGAPEAPKPWYYSSLTKQIMLGLVIGVVVGALLAQLPPEARKTWDSWLVLVRDIFLHLN